MSDAKALRNQGQALKGTPIAQELLSEIQSALCRECGCTCDESRWFCPKCGAAV